MRFKTTRVNMEYDQLHDKNLNLKRILNALDLFCEAEFKQDICLTHIFRTPDEHKELYKLTPVDKRPKDSPHMRWQAADIRSYEFDRFEIDRMLAFLNTFTGIGGKPVAIYHSIAGGANHFHVAYKG